MGGAGIFGDYQRADCDFCRESGASSEVAQCAGARGATDRGFVSSGGQRLDRRADSPLGGARGKQKWLSYVYAEILALLAALVSASLFLILLGGIGRAGASSVAT